MMTDTLNQIEITISKHKQFHKIILDKIINPVTSVKSRILQRVNGLLSMMRDDLNTSSELLKNYQSFYDNWVSYTMNKKICEMFSYLRDKVLLKDSIYNQSENITESPLYALVSSTRILNESLKHEFSPNKSLLDTSLDDKIFYVQLGKCMSNYSEHLSKFKNFLNLADSPIKDFKPIDDVSDATRTMTKLSKDIEWLKDVHVGYRNHTLEKKEMSVSFLTRYHDQMKLDVDSADTMIKNVDSHLKDATKLMETNVVKFYNELISNFLQLQMYLPEKDTTIDKHVRDLQLWKDPRPLFLGRKVSLSLSVVDIVTDLPLCLGVLLRCTYVHGGPVRK